MKVAVLVVLFGVTAGVTASDAPPAEPKPDPNGPSTDPKDLPLELAIINETEEYDLDTLGDPSEKYRKRIREAELSGERLPASRVEMQLQITNKGTSAIQIMVEGNAVELSLELTGNEVMSARAKSPPQGSVPTRIVTIAPGKSYRMPLTDLACGKMNQEVYWYLTDFGHHFLTAKLKTAVLPAPRGTKIVEKGFGQITLKSARLEFRAVRPS